MEKETKFVARGQEGKHLGHQGGGQHIIIQGKTSDRYVACIIVEHVHLSQAFLEVSVRILSWRRSNHVEYLHSVPRDIKLGLNQRDSLQGELGH